MGRNKAEDHTRRMGGVVDPIGLEMVMRNL